MWAAKLCPTKSASSELEESAKLGGLHNACCNFKNLNKHPEIARNKIEVKRKKIKFSKNPYLYNTGLTHCKEPYKNRSSFY